MKIAICDDCRQDALRVKAMLNGSHDAVLYSGAKQLLEDVKSKKKSYDLYLIDIFMDAVSGLELARQLQEEVEDAVICFVSSSDEFYREAYDLYAVQYLLKPIKQEDLEHLIAHVSQRMDKDKENSLWYRWRGRAGAIPYGKVLYVSSREHTVFIHCKDGHVQECSGKLNEIAAQICGDVFSRCHQSFIVNMYQVNSMDGNELMIAGQRIPVSRRYLADIRRRYQEVLFEVMK